MLRTIGTYLVYVATFAGVGLGLTWVVDSHLVLFEGVESLAMQLVYAAVAFVAALAPAVGVEALFLRRRPPRSVAFFLVLSLGILGVFAATFWLQHAFRHGVVDPEGVLLDIKIGESLIVAGVLSFLPRLLARGF